MSGALLVESMRFSRNQIIGGLLLLLLIWVIILFRMIFSRA
jgi:hypothetical protein